MVHNGESYEDAVDDLGVLPWKPPEFLEKLGWALESSQRLLVGHLRFATSFGKPKMVVHICSQNTVRSFEHKISPDRSRQKTCDI